MIRSRLRYLRLQAEDERRRKLSYRTIAAECGLAYTTVQKLMADDFDRLDRETLNRLCRYFRYQPGDILVYEEDE